MFILPGQIYFQILSVLQLLLPLNHVYILAPLGSIPELPALSCQELKLSEGKDSISKNYWLDPTNVGSSKLVYCDMILEGKSVYQEQNLHSVWSTFALASSEMFSPCLSDFFD